MNCSVVSLLMNSNLSLRRRLADCGNPRRALDGSPRRFAPRDDKTWKGSLLLRSTGWALVRALAMTDGRHPLRSGLVLRSPAPEILQHRFGPRLNVKLAVHLVEMP